MRVVPAPGTVLRDYRTRRFIDPQLGVEVPATDFTFAWLLAHGDVAELSDADYQAALQQREADQKAAAEQAQADDEKAPAEQPADKAAAEASTAAKAPPPVKAGPADDKPEGAAE